MEQLIEAIGALKVVLPRNKIMCMFAQKCQEVPEFRALTLNWQLQIIKLVERGAFNKTIKECIADNIVRVWENPPFVERYSTECSKIAYNLGNCDSGLVTQIIIGEIEPGNVANYSSRKLNPQASKKEFDNLILRLNQKIEHKFAKIQCRHCKGNRVVFKESAKAAADEPTSITYHCWDCDSKWTIGGK